MMRTFWDTAEQATRMPTTSEFMQTLGAIIKISRGERASIRVWGVNAFVEPKEPALA